MSNPGLPLATRRFTSQDQRDFAELSGDYNPMHMDAVFARRTALGGAATHGVNCVLWALDCLAAADMTPALGALRARFLRPVKVDEEASLFAERLTNGAVRFQIRASNDTATLGDIRPSASQSANAPAPAAGPEWPAQLDAPREADFLDEGNAAGTIAIPPRALMVEKLYPHLVRAIGTHRVQGLAAMSYLVGMVSPGLHSIFGSLDCAFPDRPGHALAFAPEAVDKRFRRIVQRVHCGDVAGKIEAFFRPAPVEQATLGELQNLVRDGEFSGVSALVVGGSRGVGALAAKLLAAGGARVTATYRQGRAEAEALAAEGERFSRPVSIAPYDVIEGDPAQLLTDHPTAESLLYFATPRIEAHRPNSALQKSILDKYLDYYVFRFEALLDAFLGANPLGKHVFYPSTVFLDTAEPEFVEYCMAKAAGEALCAAKGASRKGLKLTAPRLPRILTDQTASVTAGAMADGPAVVLASLRELYHS